jgi:hypothetical protein
MRNNKMQRRVFIFLFIICSIIHSTRVFPAIPAVERKALIAIYNSTDGDNWDGNKNWKGPGGGFNAPGTEGNWYGITVKNDHVIKIDFNRNKLNGNLPPGIGDFTHLETLNLRANKLRGNLPAELWNLTNLKVLFLGALYTPFNNKFPLGVVRLKNLRELELGSNKIRGAIPKELGDLKDLRKLDLSGNMFTGKIPPELGELRYLKFLNLSRNQLSGKIPKNLEKLRERSVEFTHYWEKSSGIVLRQARTILYTSSEMSSIIQIVLTIIIMLLVSILLPRDMDARPNKSEKERRHRALKIIAFGFVFALAHTLLLYKDVGSFYIRYKNSHGLGITPVGEGALHGLYEMSKYMLWTAGITFIICLIRKLHAVTHFIIGFAIVNILAMAKIIFLMLLLAGVKF